MAINFAKLPVVLRGTPPISAAFTFMALISRARVQGGAEPSAATRDQSDPLAPPRRRLADVANFLVWFGAHAGALPDAQFATPSLPYRLDEIAGK